MNQIANFIHSFIFTLFNFHHPHKDNWLRSHQSQHHLREKCGVHFHVVHNALVHDTFMSHLKVRTTTCNADASQIQFRSYKNANSACSSSISSFLLDDMKDLAFPTHTYFLLWQINTQFHPQFMEQSGRGKNGKILSVIAFSFEWTWYYVPKWFFFVGKRGKKSWLCSGASNPNPKK